MADADGAGPLRDRAIEHLRRRTVGEFRQEVMLYRPKILEPHFLGQHHLRNDLLIGVLDDARIVRLRNLDLVHQPKLHVIPSF
jgi:hypothetical protein